ncbi:MAG TPA: chemotaxis protein CheD [Anaerolineaceae bacterium]
MNSRSVGLGEIIVSRDPEDILVAYGLGSCLGIGMYDSTRRVAGLLHAVLPESPNNSEPPSAKYVNTGIRLLIEQMKLAGADMHRLVIRFAGGANMLTTAALSKTFDIGTRNIASAHLTFEQLNLKIAAKDVGGNTGRTVRLYIVDGKMTVRVIGSQEKEL